MHRVTLFFARDCSLCDPVRARLASLHAELGFALEEVDIGGVAELERRYRAWIPVVEVDGERASVDRLDEKDLRRRLAAAGG